MDCIDCHNTVGHPISATPERAVDNAIAAGQISRTLPFARREGVRLVKASYPSQDAADKAIDEGLRAFYQKQGGSSDQAELSARGQGLSGGVSPQRVPDDEGHVGFLSRQQGTRHVKRMLSVPRRFAQRQGRIDD